MSFPRYPNYKASGVGWFGDVPEHWSTVRYKNVFSEKRSVSGAALPSGSISFGRVVFKSDKVLNEITKATYQEVLAGEFLINPINLNYDLKSLRTGLSDIDTCVSPAYMVLRSNSVADRAYLKYQLHVFDVSHMKTLGAGVRQTITFGDIGTCPTYIPPLPEQTAIAEFLDRETGKIDELVAEQRRLMELLKEKRQAVISHAVTKGLNPHAPMKPSGIEWLGDVPEHWEVKPLRSVFKFSKGLTITKENLQDEGVHCVNYGEIHSKYGFRLNPEIHPLRCVSPEYLSSNPEALIGDGDFVFADTSEDLEGSGNFTHLRSDDQIFAGYHTIIARPRKGTCSLLLAYQIHSSVFRRQIQSQVKGVKVFSISQGILKGAKCWLPPLPEQTAIAEFLDTELAKFDTLTAEAQRAIDLLQERRTALISAAVTGQIDVRQHSPKN